MIKYYLLTTLYINLGVWIGGHNDGNPDFLEVLLEEVTEETGVNKNHYL